MDCRDRILSNDYVDILTDFPIAPEIAAGFDLCYAGIDDLYNIVYLNKEQAGDLEELFFEHRGMPKLYGLMQEEPVRPDRGGNTFDPYNLIVSGITRIQREPLSLTGLGCVIVFIDTGIDYTNPVFRNPDGSSRILAIWDQTVQSGTPPEGFYYGSEYRKEQIDTALQAPNPLEIVPSTDTNGHGSNIAAVAAGSRLEEGNAFLGAAPDAGIVVVKLKECKAYFREFYLIPDTVPAFEETDIMLAVQYADRFARAFRRPIVFCLGLGTNYGDHAGSSALSRYLNQVAVRRSRAVVVCGGNEGNAGHHYQGILDNTGGLAANRRPVEVRVGENAQGFVMQFWGSIPDVYTISIRSPGGEEIPPVRIGIRGIVTYSFIYERTRISIGGTLVEPTSGEELITIRVRTPTAGIWTFRIEAVREIHNGTFHLWLPITEFMNTETYFLEASQYVTLTEPAMTPNAISVSTYAAANNSFYTESGRGFGRTGMIKPDFAAPGVNVSVIRGTQTGSSMAAAITAGAVAQFLQWAVVENNDSIVESREVKNYFIRGAYRTFDLTYPNREWGFGRLDAAGTFNALIGV